MLVCEFGGFENVLCDAGVNVSTHPTCSPHYSYIATSIKIIS